jgi:hypothetical protein
MVRSPGHAKFKIAGSLIFAVEKNSTKTHRSKHILDEFLDSINDVFNPEGASRQRKCKGFQTQKEFKAKLAGFTFFCFLTLAYF